MSKKTDEPHASEFQNFKNLTKRLLAVPKKEVDQKREDFDNRKKRESEKKK